MAKWVVFPLTGADLDPAVGRQLLVRNEGSWVLLPFRALLPFQIANGWYRTLSPAILCPFLALRKLAARLMTSGRTWEESPLWNLMSFKRKDLKIFTSLGTHESWPRQITLSKPTADYHQPHIQHFHQMPSAPLLGKRGGGSQTSEKILKIKPRV